MRVPSRLLTKTRIRREDKELSWDRVASRVGLDCGCFFFPILDFDTAEALLCADLRRVFRGWSDRLEGSAEPLADDMLCWSL